MPIATCVQFQTKARGSDIGIADGPKELRLDGL
jgi:hypothetical protein